MIELQIYTPTHCNSSLVRENRELSDSDFMIEANIVHTLAGRKAGQMI